MSPVNQTGTSVIELMISMTLGIFLMIAIGSVYVASKDTYRVSETVARMQDNGRIAMQILTEDLQLAGFLGNNANPSLIAAPATLPPAAGDCAPGWYVHMAKLLLVSNDTTPTFSGTGFATTCLNNAGYHARTDVIALKRAANAGVPATQLSSADHRNWLLLRTDTLRGEFFEGGGAPPAGFSADVSTDRRWLAHVYYISYKAADPDPANRLPMLRRVRLGSGPAFFNDRELVRGVQDLQIQYGVDNTGDGNANRFVNPGDEGPAPVVAARIWLLIRAEEGEAGHDDSINTYVYADKRYIPGSAATDNDTETAARPEQFRRLLVSKTIKFRNRWQ